MYKSYEFLLIVFISLGSLSGFVKSSETLNKNYELLDSEQYLNDIIISDKTVALLIEDNPRNFKNALNFVQSVFSDNHYENSDFWLITFNSSGVSSVWEKSLNNVDQFYRKLETLTLESNTEDNSNKSLLLFSLLNTVQILPSKSAIVFFTESFETVDSNLEITTLNLILSKNITVFNGNDNDFTVNDIIRNVVKLSGGKNLKIRKEQKYELYKEDSYSVSQQNSSVILPRKNLVNVNNLSVPTDYDVTGIHIILSRKNLININNLSFPVDHDITGLHIVISPSKRTGGMLISPTGYKFSFSRNAKTNNIRYSQGSFFENQNGVFDLHLNFSTSDRSNVGIWQLKLENLIDFYNVSVFVFTRISAEATIDFVEKGQSIHKMVKDVMKLGVTGKISHITDISVLDRNGETVLSNVSYKSNDNRLKDVTENIDNNPDTKNKEVNVEINKLRSIQPAYALIRGKDVKGNIFQRLGYIFGAKSSDIYPSQILTVDVALGSELILPSGRRGEVYFEVTNLASSAQIVTFSCSDHKYILQSLSLYRRYLEPEESCMVTLYLDPVSGTYQDEITFSAKSGSLLVQKKVFVEIGSQTVDQNQPELYHKYTSDCTEVVFTSCKKGTWTIEITARDTESGLLQLNTEPKGLYFPYGYTSGTKDSVTGYYSESCCKPTLQISAVDRLNNIRRYEVNAYHNKLHAGVIAAIVLGVLLFIILVAVIIYFGVKRYKKKKESYDLPTYRGGGI